MGSLFLDKSKFRLINKDPSLTHLPSLHTRFNRSEINKDQFKKLRPQNAMVVRAQALPKFIKVTLACLDFVALMTQDQHGVIM